MITLRPFTLEDADAFAMAARESAATVGRWMPWCHAGYSTRDAEDWIGLCMQALADRTAYEFGIFSADGGEFLGGAGLNQFNRLHNFCNLGYWVRESRQGQGVATAAVRRLSQFGFENLRQTRIEIVVAEGNAPSKAVARKAGALCEGLARNRLLLAGTPTDATVHSLVP